MGFCLKSAKLPRTNSLFRHMDTRCRVVGHTDRVAWIRLLSQWNARLQWRLVEASMGGWLDDVCKELDEHLASIDAGRFASSVVGHPYGTRPSFKLFSQTMGVEDCCSETLCEPVTSRSQANGVSSAITGTVMKMV